MRRIGSSRWIIAVALAGACRPGASASPEDDSPPVATPEPTPAPASELPPTPTAPPRTAQVWSMLSPMVEELAGSPQVETSTLDGATSAEVPYEVRPGPPLNLAVYAGLEGAERVEAILLVAAEAHLWAQPEIADLLYRLRSSFGSKVERAFSRAYGQLRLLVYLADPAHQARITELPDAVRPTVEALRAERIEQGAQIWRQWLAVSGGARQMMAAHEPLASTLAGARVALGLSPLPSGSFVESVDPPLRTYAAALAGDDELFTLLVGWRKPADLDLFRLRPRARWVVGGSRGGSSEGPTMAEAQPVPGASFRIVEEDYGDGRFMTYVFPGSSSARALRRAFVHSLLHRQLMTDWMMLATAGSDFARRDANGIIDSETAVVPDRYDALYAACGSAAALDVLLRHHRKRALSGMKPGSTNDKKILERAHRCVIDGAGGELVGSTAAEGPAPATRMALFQMLVRFEKLEQKRRPRSADDEAIEEAEALLREIKAREDAGR